MSPSYPHSLVSPIVVLSTLFSLHFLTLTYSTSISHTPPYLLSDSSPIHTCYLPFCHSFHYTCSSLLFTWSHLFSLVLFTCFTLPFTFVISHMSPHTTSNTPIHAVIFHPIFSYFHVTRIRPFNPSMDHCSNQRLSFYLKHLIYSPTQ